MQNRFAHEVVLDGRDQSISIDGIRFPYWVMPDPEVEVIEEGVLGALRIGVLADNVTVIGRSGTVHHPITCDQRTNMEWARRRGTEIAQEGLADVLQWIGLGMPDNAALIDRIAELEAAVVRLRDRAQGASNV